MRLSKITVKVIVSYVLLICVSVVAGYIVFKEINKLSNQEKINQEDRNKIVQISKILSMVNETENAGRIAIRSDEKEALQTFLEKNVYLQNEVLKFRRDITSEKQLLTLDTISSLLNLKSNNLQELKAFQESDSTSIIIRSAIRKLSSLEPYLGYEFFDKKKNAVSDVEASDIASILKKYKSSEKGTEAMKDKWGKRLGYINAALNAPKNKLSGYDGLTVLSELGIDVGSVFTENFVEKNIIPKLGLKYAPLIGWFSAGMDIGNLSWIMGVLRRWL